MKNTSTPISEIGGRMLAGLALLALAGCAELDGLGLAGGPVPPEATVTVSRSAVTISGPRGFCVDPSATKDRDGQAFVLLGNCAAITRSGAAPQPRIRALLTAAVRETEAIEVAEQAPLLEAFLRSDNGRAMLSRESDPATVDILESFQQGDVLYVHARDNSAGYAPGMSSDHWRAIFDLDGRVVSVAVLGFEANPLSRAEGLRAVREFAARIQRDNPAL